MTRTRLSTVVSSAFLLWLAPHSARASVPDLISLGPRSGAMAGTGVAVADDWEATYQNPAGLGLTRTKLSLGFVYGGHRLRIDNEPHPMNNPAGVQIGASVPLPLGGILTDRIGIGLGLYLPAGVVNRVNVPYPELPRAALLDARTEVVSVLVGAGVRLPWGLRIGGGVLALAALVGDISIRPDGSGRITSISEEQLTVDYAPILGVGWSSPSDRWQLGLTYRGASASSYLLRLHTELGDAIPLGLPLISFAGIAQYDPRQLAAEAALRMTPSVQLVAQLAWKQWSQYRYPIEPATADSPKLPEPGFHDTVVPRVALEYRAPTPAWLQVKLRTGYWFEWSPAPATEPEDDAKNLLDTSRHVLSVGVGLGLIGKVPLDLDLFGQAHLLSPCPCHRLSGQLFVGGATVGVRL